MITQITLLRHAETDWNSAGRWQGLAPIPLNEIGISQARAVAETLRRANFTQVISSDLLRARQTATIINQILELPLTYDLRLREIDVGSWQGLTRDEIENWDPNNSQKFYDSPRMERSFPFGESYQEVGKRVVHALEDIAQLCGGQHTLVVTHGGAIRGALALIGEEKEEPHVPLANCSLTRLRFLPVDNKWRVETLGEVSAEEQWQQT